MANEAIGARQKGTLQLRLFYERDPGGEEGGVAWKDLSSDRFAIL